MRAFLGNLHNIQYNRMHCADTLNKIQLLPTPETIPTRKMFWTGDKWAGCSSQPHYVCDEEVVSVQMFAAAPSQLFGTAITAARGGGADVFHNLQLRLQTTRAER